MTARSPKFNSALLRDSGNLLHSTFNKQQTITAYEVGRRRIQVSALPVIAQALGVGVDELVSERPKPGKRGPAPKLQQQLEQLSRLPKAQQRLVSQLIDTVLQQHGT